MLSSSAPFWLRAGTGTETCCHTHTHLFIHASTPTDFRMVLVVESVLCSVCPWRNSTSDEKELEFSLVRQTWRLRIHISSFPGVFNPSFLFCLPGWKTRGKLSSQPSTRKYQMASWKSKVRGICICSESVRCLRLDKSNWSGRSWTLCCKARCLGKFHFIKRACSASCCLEMLCAKWREQDVSVFVRYTCDPIQNDSVIT